jgi:hypothetical protein
MAGKLMAEARRRMIVADWLDCGNYHEVARRHNVTEGAIRALRRDATWWDELESELAQQIADSTKVILSARARRALDLLGDRLSDGDPHVLKDGSVIYVPIRARDLTLALGLMIDKLRLMEGKPQSLRATVDLNSLANQFRDIARGRDNLVSIQGTTGGSEESEAG